MHQSSALAEFKWVTTSLWRQCAQISTLPFSPAKVHTAVLAHWCYVGAKLAKLHPWQKVTPAPASEALLLQ